MLFFCNVEYFFLNFCKITLFSSVLSQSRRLPLLQVVSKNKSFSVGVQSPTEINAPRGCAVILKRICQLSLTRITHQVSRAFDLNLSHLNNITNIRCVFYRYHSDSIYRNTAVSVQYRLLARAIQDDGRNRCLPPVE